MGPCEEPHLHQNFQMRVRDLDLDTVDPVLGSAGPMGRNACFLFPAHSYE